MLGKRLQSRSMGHASWLPARSKKGPLHLLPEQSAIAQEAGAQLQRTLTLHALQTITHKCLPANVPVHTHARCKHH